MFLLKFVPDFLIYAALLAVIIGYFASSWIPQIPQLVLVKNLCAILVPVFIFIAGMTHANNWWLQKQELHQAQVAVADQGSVIVNGILLKKGADQIEQVDSKVITVTKYIDREVTKYDSVCTIPSEFITAVNEAAKP